MSVNINYLFFKKKLYLKSEGNSMFPILHSGDLIQYQKCNFKDLSVNDIFLFKKKGALLTHRVIFKNNGYIIAKGDNNQLSDGKIYPYQIIAKAVSIKRGSIAINIDQLYLIQSTIYFKEIINIKHALEEAYIDYLLLKGLPLHIYYEGTHPRRIYVDCDLYIDPKYKEKVISMLIGKKYHQINNHFSNIQKKLQKEDIEISFMKKVNKYTIIFDIHFEVSVMMVRLGRLNCLYDQKNIDRFSQDCLRNRLIVPIYHETIPILAPEYLIIFLSLHFFHHNFQGAFRLDLLYKVIIKHKNNKKITVQCAKIINLYKLGGFAYYSFILLKKYHPETGEFVNDILKHIQIKDDQKKYIESLRVNIFDDELRIGAGLQKFKNLFYLSPEPLIKKLTVFFYIKTLFIIIRFCYKTIKSYTHKKGFLC